MRCLIDYLLIIRAFQFPRMPLVPVVRVSHPHNVAMGASTIHQSAPGSDRAHFRIVHDAVPQFGGGVVLNLISVDLIRGVIGHQHIIRVITFGRGNQFQHTHSRRLLFGEGASDDERMTSFGNQNLSFKGVVRICSAWSYCKGGIWDLGPGLCHLKNWHNLNVFASLSLYHLFPKSSVFNLIECYHLS